jgi:hypothetical protein
VTQINSNFIKKNLPTVLLSVVFIIFLAAGAFLYLRSKKLEGEKKQKYLPPIVGEPREVTIKLGSDINEERELIGKTVDNVDSVRTYRGVVESVEEGKLTLATDDGSEEIDLSEDVYVSCTDTDLRSVEYFDFGMVKVQATVSAVELGEKISKGDYVLVDNIWSGQKTYNHNIISDKENCIESLH